MRKSAREGETVEQAIARIGGVLNQEVVDADPKALGK